MKSASHRATPFAVALLVLCAAVIAGGCSRTGAPVTVDSTPSRAMVFLDDQYVGLTPATLSGDGPGKHLLRLERYGYCPLVQAIELGTGSALHFRLEVVPEGALEVVTNPDGADVWLNGELAGITPLTLDSLPVGELAVRLTHGSYEPWTGNVVIEPGKTARLGLTLVLAQEDFYVKQLEARPNDSSLALELAHIRLVKGNLDGATEAYERAVMIMALGKDVPENTRRIYHEIDMVYKAGFNYGGGDVVTAMQAKLREMFERLIDKFPDKGDLYQKLATLYIDGMMPERAGELYERLAERNPGNISAFLQAGERYGQAGRNDRAIALYLKAQKIHHSNFVIYERLGNAYVLQYQGGDIAAKDLAIEALRKAEELCADRRHKAQIERALSALIKPPEP